MKYIFYFLSITLFFGCSSKSIDTAWNATKRASYNATTDYATWVPLIGATFLYSTPYDEKLTDYFMNNEIIETDYDEYYRTLNALETYATGLMINDSSYLTKAKRVAVEFGTFELSGYVSDSLNHNIYKLSPSKKDKNSIGSRHAIPTFAGSAMTRRNVEQLNIPIWGKYTLNTISYTTAISSALVRVEEAGHSVADQFISMSVGNFIGLFMHDLFMLDDNISINASIENRRTYLSFSYRY